MSSSTLAAARDRLSEQLVITQTQFLCFSLKHHWNEFSSPSLQLPFKTCSLYNLARDGKQLCEGKNIARCHSCNNAYTWEWLSTTKPTSVKKKRPSSESGNGVTCIFFKSHQWYFVDNQVHSVMSRIIITWRNWSWHQLSQTWEGSQRQTHKASPAPSRGEQYWHRNRKCWYDVLRWSLCSTVSSTFLYIILYKTSHRNKIQLQKEIAEVRRQGKEDIFQ